MLTARPQPPSQNQPSALMDVVDPACPEPGLADAVGTACACAGERPPRGSTTAATTSSVMHPTRSARVRRLTPLPPSPGLRDIVVHPFDRWSKTPCLSR